MAVSNFHSLQAFPAGADLSQSEGCILKLDANGAVIVATAAADIPIGILVEAVKPDFTVGVLCEQGAKVPVRTSAAIAVGDRVGIAAGGKAVTSTGASVGIALEAATAADQYITILYTGLVPASA